MILACSGGSDSTFLARAWLHAAGESRLPGQEVLPEAIVAVVDHAHRSDSAADADAAVHLYRAMGLETVLLTAEPHDHRSEAGLRDLRYGLLEQEAKHRGARRVLLAHHADDNAETVLLRILRGTGLPGLAGIPQCRALNPEVDLLRPLLAFRRDAMRDRLRELHQPVVEDATNADPSAAARNAMRHRLLPELEALATGDPIAALLRLQGEAADWQEALQELLAEAKPYGQHPGYLRRQLLRAQLREAGLKVSPRRLQDLDRSLMARGQAGIVAGRRFVLKDGQLRLSDS